MLVIQSSNDSLVTPLGYFSYLGPLIGLYFALISVCISKYHTSRFLCSRSYPGVSRESGFHRVMLYDQSLVRVR